MSSPAQSNAPGGAKQGNAILRKFQAICLEILIGIICIIHGISMNVPNGSVMYRIVTETHVGTPLGMFMMSGGVMMILAAVLSLRKSRAPYSRYVRICAVFVTNGAWIGVSYFFVLSEAYGPLFFTAIVLIIFTSVMTIEGWE